MPNNNAEKRRLNKFVNSHFVDFSYKDMLTEDGYRALKTYLGNVARGQTKVFTAPFAKGDSMSKVLSDWDRVLVSLKDEWPTLYQFENDLARKVGPMSVQKPMRDRLDDVRHYYEDILLSSTPVDDGAIHDVINEFRAIGALRMRDQRTTVDNMKKSTNSGTPFFTKRRNVVQDTLPTACSLSEARFPGPYVFSSVKGTPWESAAVIGWRGQEGGPSSDDTKQRVVWMFPFNINISELQVYQPLIEQAQKFDLVPAWVSMESVDKRVTALFDTKGKDDLIVCTDFSKFDQHFNSDLQNAAKTILDALLARGSVSSVWLREVFPIKYNIPLIWEIDQHNGVVTRFSGSHGMASGSGGTNVDETLAHRALQYAAARSNNADLNPNSQCLGDDGILSYPGITVEDVVREYQSHGQECNPDKQYSSTQDCVYLRRWHHINYRVDGICVGVYSTCRALGRLRYLERFMDPEYWSPELVALRQLSILENCKFHPLKEEFVQFCMKRDKYRLGLDIPGFFDNITRLATEATDHIQDFLGYTKTLQGAGPEGISSWWVVNYLKSLR